MSIILCSQQGIHYEGGPKGGIQAIFVAGANQRRVFTDLDPTRAKEVADRYGTPEEKPLYRIEQGNVVGYGTLPHALGERREALELYLPEQIAPVGCTVFYFVFGNQWIVHGVRMVNDDGQVHWASSRILLKDEQKAQDVLIEALSQHMLEAKDETYCIAVSGNDEAFVELKERLKDFELEAVRLESLKPPKAELPIYKHQNHSLVMMTIALLALMVALASGGWWLMQSLELKEKLKQVEDVQRKIRAIPKNEHIGYIRNPQQVLAKMDKALQQAPSSILNAAAQMGGEFGVLESTTLDLIDQAESLTQKVSTNVYDNSTEEGANVVVHVEVSQVANTFLIDQENLARGLVEKQPWVRDIKGYGKGQGGDSIQLDIVVRVD